MNLSSKVGDAPRAVQANRALFARYVPQAVFLHQVHGDAVLRLHAADASRMQDAQADASFTRETGLACTVMVADCLPVLFARKDGTAVAAAHAGWRGLLGRQGQGVLEAVVAALLGGTQAPQALMAWLGPCIGPQAFEVGPEVFGAFTERAPWAAACFMAAPVSSATHPKWRADLPALVRACLRAMGVTAIYGNDGGQCWCTVSNPERFFSHRRDQPRYGATGRMAAAVWIAGD